MNEILIGSQPHTNQKKIRSVLTYSYVSDGLLQVGEKAPAWQPTLVPGQIKLKNLYDTGTSPNVLDQYDKVNLGSQDPKCTLGLNNTH